MRKLYFFIALFFCCQSLLAQVNDTLEVVAPIEEIVETDENLEEEDEEKGANELRKPYVAEWAADSLPALRKQKAFGYMATLDSQLRHLTPEPLEKDESGNSSMFDFSPLRTLFWILAIGAVIFILFRLLAGSNNLFSRNKILQPNDADDAPKETIKASPIALAQQAAAAGNFRMAVRYQYIYILQRMGEKRLVQLQPQKTNAQYLYEVNNLPLKNEFATLTLQYEYIWYGEFAITQEQYDTISAGFRKYTLAWL